MSEIEEKRNPLIDKMRIPGETFRLPSGGAFYKNGELDPHVKHGEVHVYPMTTIDEIVMRSPDKVFRGDAACEVIRRCVPDVLKPEKLFGKDIDFLMMCLKKVSYGNRVEQVYNHGCNKESQPRTYTLNINDFIKKTKQLDLSSMAEKFQKEIIVGDSTFHVKFHPLRFEDFVRSLQDIDDDMSEDSIRNHLCNQLTDVVELVQIEDEIVTDREMIYNWVDKLPVMSKKEITDVIEESSKWGPELDTVVECQECGKEIRIEVPVNPTVFFS